MQTTRAKVIEKGVEFEASITQVLAFLLDIDLSISKILGDTTQAMPVNSKFMLLHELNITPKEIKEYFKIFVEIRNKFAHVRECDTFSYYFNTYSNPTSKTKFLKLAENINIQQLNEEEERLLTAFDVLCFSISTWLKAIIKIAGNQKKVDDKKTAIIEMLRLFKKKQIRSLEEYRNFHQQCYMLVDEIPKDEELLKLVEEEAIKVKKK